MTVVRVTETHAYEVGKTYAVPCVKSVRYCKNNAIYKSIFMGEWIPIMGPLHRDAGVVGFPALHWHIDWRFASERLWKRMLKRYPRDLKGCSSAQQVYALPLQRHPSYPFGERTGFAGLPLNQHQEDVNDSWIEGGVVERRRVCLRDFPKYPRPLASWMAGLEKECSGLRMKNMVCPHRGIPLHNVPVQDGIVTCPGHGLRWHAATGWPVIERRK